MVKTASKILDSTNASIVLPTIIFNQNVLYQFSVNLYLFSDIFVYLFINKYSFEYKKTISLKIKHYGDVLQVGIEDSVSVNLRAVRSSLSSACMNVLNLVA